MKRNLYSISCGLFSLPGIIFLLVLSATIHAQQENPCNDIPPHKDDFLLITDLTIELQQGTTDLKNKIKDLNSKIPMAESAERDIKRADELIAGLNSKASKTTLETEQLDYLTSKEKPNAQFRLQELGGKSSTELKQDLKQAQEDLSWNEAKQRCLKSELTQMQSPTHKFKSDTSWIFGCLIGLVIVGFFILALDPVVRRAVFAGQVGLQFIALFSIVIAIILFGITAVLEAKELSALLGSLAGYILGRTMSNPDGSNSGSSDNLESDFANKVATINVAPQSVTLNTENPTAILTVSFKDSAGNKLIPSAGITKPTWKSNDPTVASIDSSGTVKRVKSGTAVITAEFNGKTANCAVTCN